MKRINTHSTLVFAKHGLLANGKYTKIFDPKKGAKYVYELHVRAPQGQGCAGTCAMAAPSVLKFKTGNPAPVAVSLIGGFGSHSDDVLALNPTSSGQQKVELVAQVTHGIGPVKLADAFNVAVVYP